MGDVTTPPLTADAPSGHRAASDITGLSRAYGALGLLRRLRHMAQVGAREGADESPVTEHLKASIAPYAAGVSDDLVGLLRNAGLILPFDRYEALSFSERAEIGFYISAPLQGFDPEIRGPEIALAALRDAVTRALADHRGGALV